ncbi:fungal cellulose binding domain-containing protein [Plectosphaerella cucumerina]|uniref:Fungal cellulose binding domain-containing protein n=1 Tax=Plectosphaerella cucumerina TaxID=40658 RepID=A0A8K0T4K1_9PEZI|nr:fungal cellulose binding domain-containing protein [Plectosphaerella cucumerina]
MKTAVLLLAVSAMASAQAAGPWAQCGGIGFTGPTTCVAGWTCVRSNDWYSQCLQGAVTSTPPTTTLPPTVPTTTSSPAPPSSTASDDDGCPAVPN